MILALDGSVMNARMRAVAGMLAALSLGGCYEYTSAQYLHRTDTITMSAGNAKAINDATHVIDPWNRKVANPRIPDNGDRAARVIARYRTGSGANGTPNGQVGQSGQPATSPSTSSSGLTGTSPMQ
jgi:hypothetical protein